MPRPHRATEAETTAERSHEILARFDRYHPVRIDLTLDRIVRLLADLGDPQRRLPPVIHVAGTNGKGSTIAFLRAIYEAAGSTVSTYTSPHLVDITERFVLAGKTIATDALLDLLEEVDAANRGQSTPSSRSSRPQRLLRCRGHRRISCCWKLALVAATTPPTSSTRRWQP